MLEVVVNYLYPALTTVKTDWLFLCTPDSVMFAASRPLPRPQMRLLSLPLTGLFLPEIPFTYFEAWSRKLRPQLTSLAHSCS